jgi:hypothetical protein
MTVIRVPVGFRKGVLAREVIPFISIVVKSRTAQLTSVWRYLLSRDISIDVRRRISSRAARYNKEVDKQV